MRQRQEHGSPNVTVQNIDSQQLAQAASLLGTHSDTDTVGQALREVIRRRVVRDYIAFLKQTAPPEYENPRLTAW